MKAKKAIKVLTKAIELLKVIPKKEFDYQEVLHPCGTKGCIIGHWAIQSSNPDVQEIVKNVNKEPLGDHTDLGVYLAKDFKIECEGPMYNFITLGYDLWLEDKFFYNNLNNSKKELLKLLKDCRSYIKTLDPKEELDLRN